MSPPVNLNRFRKDKPKSEAKKLADANAVRFGRTKGEKASDAAEAARKSKLLDGTKRE